MQLVAVMQCDICDTVTRDVAVNIAVVVVAVAVMA